MMSVLRLSARDLIHAAFAATGSTLICLPLTRFPIAQGASATFGAVLYLAGLTALRRRRSLIERSDVADPGPVMVRINPPAVHEFVPPGELKVGGIILCNNTVEASGPGQETAYGYSVYLTAAQIRGYQYVENNGDDNENR